MLVEIDDRWKTLTGSTRQGAIKKPPSHFFFSLMLQQKYTRRVFISERKFVLSSSGNHRLVGETRGNEPKEGKSPAARVGNDG